MTSADEVATLNGCPVLEIRRRRRRKGRGMIDQLDNPLLALWKEWKRLDAEKEARREDASEMEMIGWSKRRVEIEKQIAKQVPLTPESAAVLVQLLTYWTKNELFPSDDQHQRILKNLLTWIEGLDDA